MAAYYIRQMRKVQPRGPYFLGGYSSGGTVALEIAHQLRASGEEVALLAILDSPSPKFNYWRPNWDFQFWRGLTGNIVRNLGYWARTYQELPGHQKRRLIVQRVRYARRTLQGLLRRRGLQPTGVLEDEQRRRAFFRYLGEQPGLEDLSQWPAHRVRVLDAELQALNSYEPAVYPGQITLYRARRQPLMCSYEPTKGWSRLSAQRVRIIEVPGSHHSIIEEPYVTSLAAALKRTIDATVPRNQPAQPAAVA
jgi:thioesterase domain-containing protein